MSDIPLEYALIVFEGNKFSGKIAPGLLELVERGWSASWISLSSARTSEATSR